MRPAGGRPKSPRGDGIISALKVRNRQPDRMAVYLDGSYAFDLATGLVDEGGLHTGDLLSREAQERLLHLDAPHRGRSRALRLLALRDRSRHEVETALRRSGFEPQVIVDTVDWLTAIGYLDDARFATSYAAERLRAGWGERRVRAELRRKGIERDLMQQAVESEGDDPQAAMEGAETVLRLARRRFGRQFGVDPQSAERRLAGFLLRRGYDWETVGKVARALRLETGAGPNDACGSDR